MTFAFPGLRREGCYWEEDTMSKTPKITAFLLTFFVAACAACASPQPPTSQPPTSMVRVPDKLKPGANESLAMIVPAKGVQIYECRARKDQVGEYEWAFVAPEADLFDARGNRIGRHYAGPHWESTDPVSARVEEIGFGSHERPFILPDLILSGTAFVDLHALCGNDHRQRFVRARFELIRHPYHRRRRLRRRRLRACAGGAGGDEEREQEGGDLGCLGRGVLLPITSFSPESRERECHDHSPRCSFSN